MDDQEKKSGALYVDLARNQLQKGQPALALSNLLKAEKLDPNSHNLHNQFGLTYFVFKKYEKAVDHFERALKIDPNFTEARNNYARTLIELGRFEEARRQLQLVSNDLTYTNQSMALSHMGLSYFRQGRYREAIPLFQQSIKLNKNNCHTYSLYARALYEMKDFSAAMPAFDVAVPLCKKIGYDEPHYFAALTYFKSGDKNKGIALMNETILLYPDGAYQGKARSMLELMKLNKL